jgi:hypothetical protein
LMTVLCGIVAIQHLVKVKVLVYHFAHETIGTRNILTVTT